MIGGAVDAGSVITRLGFSVDRSGVTTYDRLLDRVRRERPVTTELRTDADTSGIRQYEHAVRRADAANNDLVRGGGRVRNSFGWFAAGGPAVGAAVVGLGAATAGAVGLYNAYEESYKVGQQTAAVIKSTGGEAGVSAKHVGDLATALSKKSGADDEAIQSGENLLLTFTRIRNEQGKGNQVFDRASSIALDMSKALGVDMTQSAIQVGKALNDPIKGVTALQRVGVSFTEQQKDQIKTMVKSGDTLGAQKLVLRELEKEFGGTAASQATNVDRLKVSLGNLAENAGGVLAPAVNSAAGELTHFVDDLDKTGTTANKIRRGIGQVATVIGNGLGRAAAIGRRAFQTITRFVEDNRGKIDDLVGGYKTLASLGGRALDSIGKAFDKVFGGSGVGSDIKRIASTLIQLSSTLLNKVMIPIVRRILPGIGQAFEGLFKVIRGVVRLITGILTGDFGKAWDGLKDIFKGGVKAIGGILRAGTAPIRAAASAIGKAVWSVLEAGWHQAEVGARKFVNSVIDVLNLIPGVNIKHVTWGSDSSGGYKPNSAGKGNVAGPAYTKHRDGGMGRGSLAAVSSGEVVRHPDGTWSRVPGKPTAADNVLTWLDDGAEVYTWDGQQRLAAGMTRQQTLATQLPHFSLGGVLKTAANVVTAPARGAASLISKGASWLIDKLPDVPGGFLGGALGWAKNKAIDWAKDKIASLNPFGGGETSTTGLVAQVMRALAWARSHGWRGTVTSGFRDPAHQLAAAAAFAAQLGKPISAVYPNGPLASSHVKGQAVDVTDPAGFAAALAGAPADSKLYNRIPWDPVHYSVSGYRKGGQHSAMWWAKHIGKIGDFDPVAALREGYREQAQAKNEARKKGERSEWTKAYKRFISSTPAGHPTLSSASVKALAKFVGLPPDMFDKIAKGESGRAPGIQQPDPGDGNVGYGLWQNTPHAWGAGSAAMRYFRSLGGVSAMFVPLKNARMAKFLYDHAPSKKPGTKGFPWFGTQYLRLGGIVQAFRKGGVAKGSIGGKGSAHLGKGGLSHNSTNPGVERSVQRAEKGVASYERKIQNLEKEYDQLDRQFGIRPLELVTENADGTATLNEDAISAREQQIQQLIDKRAEVKRTIEAYRAAVAALMTELRKAIDKLTRAIKASPGKARAKVRDGYEQARQTYRDRLGELGDVYGDLGYDIRDAELDLQELAAEKDAVRGDATSQVGSSSSSSDASPTAAQIAAEAQQQLATFMGDRANLLKSFGSNIGAAGGPSFASDIAKAAGLSYYGGAESSPRTVVNQTNHFANAPASPGTFVEETSYRMKAVL